MTLMGPELGPESGPELVEENEVTAADRPRLSIWRGCRVSGASSGAGCWRGCRLFGATVEFPLRLLARLFSHDFAAINLASLVCHGLAAFF